MPTRKTTTTSRKNYATYFTTARNTRTNQPPTSWYPCNSRHFMTLRNEFQWRIGSYQNVYNQFNSGRRTVWSPTVANRWMRYVKSGVQVYQFTNREFTRFFGNRFNNANPTVIRKFLTNRYGHSIKDVTRGNNNTWLIAASRTPSGRLFTNYNWK